MFEKPGHELLYLIDENREKLLDRPVPVVKLVRKGANLQEERGMLKPNEAIEKNIEPLRRKNCPNIVVGIPHSGLTVPGELYDRLTDGGKKQLALIDDATDRIGRIGDFPSVLSTWSRFVADCNRPALGEIDTGGERALEIGSSNMIWTIDAFHTNAEGKPISAFKDQQTPSAEEVQQWAEITHVPYYHAAMAIMASVHDRMKPGERALFVDVHSFPLGLKFDEFASKWIGKESFSELSLFNLGWKNDFNQICCDADIIEELRLAIIDEFRSLSVQLQEKLIQKPVSTIMDKDIVETDHLLQGLENAEFWGNLRSQKRPGKETTKEEIDAMNQRLANFRKSSGINMLQIEMKESYKYYPTMTAPDGRMGPDYDNATPNRALEQAVQQVMQKALLKVNKKILKLKI